MPFPTIAPQFLRRFGVNPTQPQQFSPFNTGPAIPRATDTRYDQGGFWNLADSDNAAIGGAGIIARLIYNMFGPPGYGKPGYNPKPPGTTPDPVQPPAPTGAPGPAPMPPAVRGYGFTGGMSPGQIYNAGRPAFSPTYQQLTNPGSAIGPISGSPSYANLRNARGLGTVAGAGFGIDSFSATARGEAYRKNQI